MIIGISESLDSKPLRDTELQVSGFIVNCVLIRCKITMLKYGRLIDCVIYDCDLHLPEDLKDVFLLNNIVEIFPENNIHKDGFPIDENFQGNRVNLGEREEDNGERWVKVLESMNERKKDA